MHDSDASSTRGFSRQQRWLLGALGALGLASGAVAVFLTENGPGAAALLGLGGITALFAVQGSVPSSIEFAGSKVAFEQGVQHGVQVGMEQGKQEGVQEAVSMLRSSGEEEAAGKLRRLAAGHAVRSQDFAEQIELIRETLPQGHERSRLMDNVMDRARRAAQEADSINIETVREAFGRGGRGRVIALAFVHARPDLADPGVVTRAILEHQSGFEIWHGLMAAKEGLRAKAFTAEALAPVMPEIARIAEDPRFPERSREARAVLDMVR